MTHQELIDLPPRTIIGVSDNEHDRIAMQKIKAGYWCGAGTATLVSSEAFPDGAFPVQVLWRPDEPLTLADLSDDERQRVENPPMIVSLAETWEQGHIHGVEDAKARIKAVIDGGVVPGFTPNPYRRQL